MPSCDFSPERYQSLPYSRVLEIHKQHLSPVETAYFQKPLLLHQGHMEWLFDSEGNRYLDFFSGIVTVSVGHCHPKVTTVAQKQMDRLWHTSSVFFHPPMHEYAEKLSALLPEPLKVIFLVNSGSEANDLAMVMARAYSNHTDLISFRGAYHGCSPYTLGLTNVGIYKVELPSGMGCQSGVNGVVQYPKEFLKEAFALVRERGGVCIADEVQTGFGRLGSHFWGFQSHDVLPDIVTMAKGIGNGFPMAAVVTTPEIAKSLAKCLHHFNTFGGSPLACAIGSAVLEVIKEENLQKNSQEVGTYMLLKFAELRDEFDIVGDVRGKGLMMGIEMVQDKTFRIAPPMCISKLEVDFAFEVFRAALIQHMERRAK
ncbi:Alanine--glyoxylate aminotransferase 2, mitochondrial [Cricetulus griseus]|uniref:Alanine--glyoxylate aminotransferase 2, mitochondrial n=1 Tax=Cricetulus griseus TaxID=10029 RepID=G3HKF8_CRIGR|nr:Alanine--glyoxylate aminotransferase 2, mitochondrial [Cricetulus griseus]